VSRFEPNLRIPGPTALPPSVRDAGARQMINHRGPEFAAMLARIQTGMQPYFGTTGEIQILSCAGTGGLEAAVVDRDDPTHLDFPYMRWIADVLDVGWRSRAPLQAVHVGGGGCVLPRYLAATRPGSHSEAYESDPAVLRALGTVLDLRAEPGLRVREGDGRELLSRRPVRSADVVVTDAFSGPIVPAHLTTVEYQHEVRRALRAGGVHLMNLIDAPPGRAARRQAATLLDAFAEVVLIAPRAVVNACQRSAAQASRSGRPSR